MHRQIDFSFKANVVARWRSSPAQFVPLGIFFDRNRDRSFESGKSLSKPHENSLRANRGWFITTMFSMTCDLPGVLPLVRGDAAGASRQAARQGDGEVAAQGGDRG